MQIVATGDETAGDAATADALRSEAAAASMRAICRPTAPISSRFPCAISDNSMSPSISSFTTLSATVAQPLITRSVSATTRQDRPSISRWWSSRRRLVVLVEQKTSRLAASGKTSAETWNRALIDSACATCAQVTCHQVYIQQVLPAAVIITSAGSLEVKARRSSWRPASGRAEIEVVR
jgi:hypothetical protein